MTGALETRPYLSVVTWPEDHGRELVAQLLADATGSDYESLRLRLGVAPPTIVGHFEPQAAHAGLTALREAGGGGFATTLTELAAMGSSLPVRDLRLVDGVIEVDIWRGPTTRIRREDVRILVRAHLTRRQIDPIAREAGVRDKAGAAARMGMTVGLGGMGLALAVGAAYAQSAAPMHTLSTSDKLDIHTANGLIFQIDGDKFGFQALGDMRGYGDKDNMDKMCDLLAHVSPDEIVDPYFELWNPPAGFDRLRLPGLARAKSEMAFAFYSRWAATMYRYMLR